MRCPACGFRNKYGALECRECSAPLDAPKPSKRELPPKPLTTEERERQDALWLANYERRKYSLCGQGPGESDIAFCARINQEKTEGICQHNQEIAQSLEQWGIDHPGYAGHISTSTFDGSKRLTANEREPGCDDE